MRWFTVVYLIAGQAHAFATVQAWNRREAYFDVGYEMAEHIRSVHGPVTYFWDTEDDVRP